MSLPAPSLAKSRSGFALFVQGWHVGNHFVGLHWGFQEQFESLVCFAIASTGWSTSLSTAHAQGGGLASSSNGGFGFEVESDVYHSIPLPEAEAEDADELDSQIGAS